MALLTRDEILDAKDLKTEDIAVPEWGGTVRIKTLTGTERDTFEQSLVEMKKDGSVKSNRENVRARLVALCIVNEAGEALFNNADIRLLGRKSASALDRVASAAQELNAFSDDDVAELAENFEPAPSESSTTA